MRAAAAGSLGGVARGGARKGGGCRTIVLTRAVASEATAQKVHYCSKHLWIAFEAHRLELC